MSLLTIPVTFTRAALKRKAASALAAMAAAALLAGGGAPFGSGTSALAQVPPVAPGPPAVDDLAPAGQPQFQKTHPTEKQSLTNPFPRGGGDSQNRSRGSSDIYWGMTDANTPWYLAPLSRSPNILANVTGLGSDIPVMTTDGWQYPRLSRDGVYQNVGTGNAYALAAGAQGVDPTTSVAYWQAVTVDANGDTTSSNVNSPGIPGGGAVYFRALAVPRPTTPAFTYPAAQKFAWSLELTDQIGGDANVQKRYRIYVHIPNPPLTSDTAQEDRISDARYTVYYYLLRSGGNANNAADYIPKQQTYIVSQTGPGEQVLRNDDGTEAFFPLFTSKTFSTGFGATLPPQTLADGATSVNPPLYTAAAIHQGVSLDNTTEDTGDPFAYVIADDLILEPGLDRLVATPTVTPPHGGPKMKEFDTAERSAVVGTVPFIPLNFPDIADGHKKNQFRSFLPSLTRTGNAPYNKPDQATQVTTTNYNPGLLYADPFITSDLQATGGGLGQYYTTSAGIPTYINDPADPLYDRNNAIFNPGGYNSPSYPLETWNPSTVFEGPESLLDPRIQYNPNLRDANGVAITDVTDARYILNQVPLARNPQDHPFGEQVGPGVTNRPRVQDTDPATGKAYPATLGITTDHVIKPTEANNFQRYGSSRAYTGTGPGGIPAIFRPTDAPLTAASVYQKLFSHIQVIVARVEYALDPETGVSDADKTGTKTIQLGAVYSYDWLTGTPLWRFPDRTYLPEGTKEPGTNNPIQNFYLDTSGTANFFGPDLAGLRNHRLGGATAVDPVTKFPVFEVPGIVYADRNGDGRIDDDEVFIGVDGAFTFAGVPLPGVPVSRTDLTGGAFASVTLAPKVMVQGDVKVPTYAQYNPSFNPDILPRAVNGVASAAYGRYSTEPSADSTAGYDPVPIGMAFVAAANGVIYGIDAYGNNDTRYEEFRYPNGTLDTYQLGKYRSGTTNVIWTFNATQHPQISIAEPTGQKYYARLQQEVPRTLSFGASAPVLAYKYDDALMVDGPVPVTVPSTPIPSSRGARTAAIRRGGTRTFINPSFSRDDGNNAVELRLFVGNTNGVVYALDASGKAGIITTVNGGLTIRSPRPLPIRKGVQPDTTGYVGGAAIAPDFTNSYTAGDPRYNDYRKDLKWWFRTRGVINYSPAVSVMQQDSGQTAFAGEKEKGVYIASEEGRIYCFDWDGPVQRRGTSGTAHIDYLNFDGLPTSAIQLNDDWFFHNQQPVARPFADLTEGNVRPRWTFPNLYRDIGVTAAAITTTDISNIAQPNGTLSGDAAGAHLGDPETLGAITTSPVLLDSYWKDPADATAAPKQLSYVLFAANDPTATGILPSESRVYMLDQVGDRVNILTNSRRRGTALSNVVRAVSQARDRFSPKKMLADTNDSTIPTGLTWTYRWQYDYYPLASTPQRIGQTGNNDVDLRNSPNAQYQNGSLGTVTVTNNATTVTQQQSLRGSNTVPIDPIALNITGQPGRRMVATVFVGGGGELYAIDIDPATGLFMRWRPDRTSPGNYLEMRSVMPLNPTTFRLPSDPEDANKVIYPSPQLEPENADDQLNPVDVMLDPTLTANQTALTGGYNRGDLVNSRVLARRVALIGDASQVTAITASGGPLQNRNNRNTEFGLLASTTPPSEPLPFPIGYTGPTTITPPAPYIPTVPQGIALGYNSTTTLAPIPVPTNDVPNLRIFDLDTTQPDHFDPNGLFNRLIPLGHLTNNVNQNIDDPLSDKRGSLNSNPLRDLVSLSSPDAGYYVANTAYQYGSLFVTTLDGNLHELSTNIEGEDYLNNNAFGDAAVSNPNITSDPVGWAFAAPGNPLRYNGNYQVHSFIIEKVGGPAGIAMVTNAFFPALDPAATLNASTDTPPAFSYTYGPREPNQTTPYPGGNINDNGVNNPLANPNPEFRARPEGYGVVANTTAVPPVLEVVSDIHGGQSGFPLDPNGLFFDKRWALAGAASPQDPNANGTIALPGTAAPENQQQANGDFHVRLTRLPGYSGIGEALQSVDAAPPAGYTVNPTYVPPTLFSANDELPSGVRYNAFNTNATVTNIVNNGVVTVNGINVGIDDLTTDDINPAGQNITWIYTGADDGTINAYTPAVPGQESGFAGGIPLGGSEGIGDSNPLTNARVDVFPESIYKELRAGNTANLKPENSIFAKGGRNLFEWGETVYIVVYNVFVSADPISPTSTTDPLARTRARNRFFSTDPTGIQLQVKVTDRRTNGSITFQRTAGLWKTGGETGNGTVVTYPATSGPAAAANGKVGYALIPWQLSGPSGTNPMTPSPTLDVQVTQTGAGLQQAGRVVALGNFEAGAGSNLAAQQENNPAAHIGIANPIALQGFLSNTKPDDATGQVTPVNVAGSAITNLYNSVGPFLTGSDQFSTTIDARHAKNHLLDAGTSTGTATDDPSATRYAYYQALANGNLVQRVDMRPYLGTTAAALANRVVNPNYGNPIMTSNGGGIEPSFYFPVVTSPGYVNSGSSATTTLSGSRQLFRMVNRSLLRNLANLRALPDDQPGDMLFRSWTGPIMNADAVEKPVAASGDNARLNPTGMHPLGVINPLPWEVLPADAKPWNKAAAVNNSLDYPDITVKQNKALTISLSGEDITSSNGVLMATVAQSGVDLNNDPVLVNSQVVNLTVPDGTGRTALTNPNAVLTGAYATSVGVSIPRYQPANLVSATNLTSSYYPPSTNIDVAGTGVTVAAGTTQGPVQMPRGDQNRILRAYDINGDQTAEQAITPFGYTSHDFVFIDYDKTNRLLNPTSQQRVSGSNPNQLATSSNYSGKTYREFEVWTGVPVDQSMKVVESVVDMGALPHGFGTQNGALGYKAGGTTALDYGLLPYPLFNTTTFQQAPYTNYSKTFTVQMTGNTNMYNLRAGRKIEAPQASGTAGSGNPYVYLALRSELIDPTFGILASGGDPTENIAPNNRFSPVIVTSLDDRYDTLWDAFIQTQFIDANGNAMTAPDATGVSPYDRYYKEFGGLHTGTKARVGAITPSVLTLPDVPRAVSLRSLNVDATGAVINNDANAQMNTTLRNNVVPTQVLVGVPLGTPAGTYQSSNAQFSIFENHDTPSTGYLPTPRIVSGAGLAPNIFPAGPLYGGASDGHPGNPNLPNSGQNPLDSYVIHNAPRRIQTTQADPYPGNDVFRIRRILADATAPGGFRYEYQPATQPSLNLKLTVTEAPLTGQAPDRALSSPTSGQAAAIFSGLLPMIDPAPLYTPDTSLPDTNSPAGSKLRPSSALSPAAWRDTSGNVHVYFSRNDNALTGSPYRLFESTLTWDAASASFQAARPGVPLNSNQVLGIVAGQYGGSTAPTGSEGTWFKQPTLVTIGGTTPPSASLLQPSVLTHYPAPTTANPLDAQITPDGATLFFTGSLPVAGGTPVTQIFYTALDPATGAVAAGGAQPFLDTPDPSLARYAPRAAFDDTTGIVYLMYYGGAPGKYALYYAARDADRGTPTGTSANAATRNRERQLTIPTSITSASDPTPIFRSMQVADPLTGVATTQNVVDVYYTGIMRATQSPDIYMTRYSVDRSRRMNPLTLPRILQERLASNGKDGLFRSRAISWYHELTSANLRRLPQIYIQRVDTTIGLNGLEPVGTQNNWRYDNSTGVLYQTFIRGAGTTTQQRNSLTYIYVDTSSGLVRFRGPLSPQLHEYVMADYEPQTYRITNGGGANYGPSAIMDNRLLLASIDPVKAINPTDSILRRTGRITAGRNWLFWQRGSSGNLPGSLFYRARRVGIDLKNPAFGATALGATDSIALTQRDTTTLNQTPQVIKVVIGGTQAAGYADGFAATSWDVDEIHSKIYVDPIYEGLPITVTYLRASDGQQVIPYVNVLRTDGTTIDRYSLNATYIDEITNASNNEAGLEAPLVTRVNEGQPYAFLDTFDPFANPASRTDPNPGANRYNVADPTLAPGRVWLLWSSPQARKGSIMTPDSLFPWGYNLYWETLAPNFDPPSYAPVAPTTTTTTP